MRKPFLIAAMITMTMSAAPAVSAAIQLPHILGDGMVLQRGDSIRLWGRAAPGEEVRVRFLKKSCVVSADGDGHWRVALPPVKAGGPYDVYVGDTVLHDVYVGDVWLTSGQSNVDLTVGRVEDLYKAETDAYANPAIHLIQVATRSLPDAPRDDLDGSERWEALRPDLVGHWSAISYFFAREMYEATGVPQGIINSSQGGSAIEGWISRTAMQEAFPKYIKEVDYYLTDGYMQRCRELNAAIGARYAALQEQGDPGVQGRWMNPDLDDTGWERVDPFARGLGEWQGKPWRGTLWFRREFTLPDDAAGQGALLRLGCLIDADETYVNGQKVGSTGYQYPPRKYTLPAGLLRPGRNVVCIRLKTGGNPEKFVREKPYKLILADGREVALDGSWRMRRGVMMPAQPGVGSFDNLATGYYNGMIAPITPYRIGGIVWYQGESNTGRAHEYQQMLETLARDWRGSFGPVPMVIVQLANFMQRHDRPVESGWAALRDAQRRAAEAIPNAALATAADLGEWNDIHPLNKKDLAHRVALQARRLAFGSNAKRGGCTVADSEGPAYDACRIAGDSVILSFRDGTDRFALPDGTTLGGFCLQGADGQWHTATARLAGRTVVVRADGIATPVAVRYAWDDNPLLTLYGSNGLPAAPFSTTP